MRKPFDLDFKVTQKFNDICCRGSYSQFGLQGHNGVDYGCPAWTLILAPHSGTIIEATNDPGGYGNYIKIENGVEGSVLAHLSKLSVGVGEIIPEGGLIGYSGNSGNSTAPHLHCGFYRIPRRRDNGFAGFIDQTDWLSAISAQPSAQEINDQTKIPIGGDYGEMELQAIRSILRDQTRAIVSLRNNLDKCLQRPQNGPNSASNVDNEPISYLPRRFLEFLRKLFSG